MLNNRELHRRSKSDLDLINDIIALIRETITTGLVTHITLKKFKQDVKSLSGHELEKYLQGLWDIIPTRNKRA
jgi:hypothetical protein